MINWILVPACNNVHLTKRAIKSFLRQNLPAVRVLLIDNATQDGTREWARTMYPRVVTLTKTPALSVAAAWNLGLTVLFEGTGNPWVLVVNNDVELRPETYTMLTADGSEFITAVGNDDRKCLEGPLSDNLYERRPNPDFSCFLIRRKAWEVVGRFDENFKGAFAEDWDYHVRLHKAGIKACCINVPFYHVGSATVKSMNVDDATLLCEQADLNRQYFKEKHGMQGGSKEYEEFFSVPHDGC